MSDVNSPRTDQLPGLTATLVFKLGTLGTVATDRFTRALDAFELGLKPKHVAVMVVLGAGAAASQQELAARMGVAPSLVVSLADHLEQLGAVQRVRDPHDRRRQVLTLTSDGRRLLDRCEAAGRALDDELAAGLTVAQRAALDEALRLLANQAGLP
ncbi:MarR family winged helix-turn-helix transcriptional regulator [Streptacidiphilus jiangxiensis]|uniref:DNA-binding transcriptional regulator, MarR family n=1 Tax=Streptacidiphilus jiangxiensis TaxID=235985 RepID=A0A1H7KR35_STRJI|nr:MarR family winged helix-turn-helix transcriptional regulator [Streptacidiphilus jiangxiensis]SEK88980.1 DNA-binding transcriptional regulator, MarR family [Streptacidiphilus jiangxiensis]